MVIDKDMPWKAIVFISLLCSPISLHAQTNAATAQIRPALQILDSTKEQDGLIGSVRRVKTEYATINLKEGRPIEGPRQLLEVTTYGVKGNRIDNVSYPIAGSTVGREEYKYDARGNIIEKILRDETGAVLSRESYEYVFDKVGNWTKMVTSLVVVEDGELKREPTEVTYRALTYYGSVTDAVAAAPAENVATSQLTVPNVEPSEKTSHATLDRQSRRKAAKTTDTQTAQADTGPPSEPIEDHRKATSPSLISVPTAETGTVVPTATAEIVAAKLSSSADTYSSPAQRAPDIRMVADPAPARRDDKPVDTASHEEPALRANSFPTSESPKKVEPEREPTTGAGINPAPSAKSPNKAFEMYKIGRQRFDVGDVQAAIDAYVESIRLEPGSAEVQMNLGHAYLSIKKDKDAMKAFKEAVRLNPELAEAYYGLGFVSFRSAKFKEAVDAFKKAITLTPDMAKAHYGLALAYIELEKLDDMIQEYRILQRLDGKLAAKLSQAFPDIDRCRGTRYCR
jgi:hypothetical protein